MYDFLNLTFKNDLNIWDINFNKLHFSGDRVTLNIIKYIIKDITYIRN
jgi:hypothetical protein